MNTVLRRRCDLDTYVSAGNDEDGHFYYVAECNGPIDCGWNVDLDDEDEPYCVSTTGFRELEASHRTWSFR